jgi:hypothetical protein
LSRWSASPGIGKASLLRDAAEQPRRRGFTTATGKTKGIDRIAPRASLLALRSVLGGPQPPHGEPATGDQHVSAIRPL